MSKLSSKQLVYASAAIALAMVTSMIKLFSMPMGGSVTLLSMLFISGAAYGLLQFVIEPYFFTIPQVVVDYLLAFGALGLSGFFRNYKYGLTIGYLAGAAGRCLFAFFSGWIFFGAYASDYGMAAPVYSLVYNGSYLGAEALITILVIQLPPVKKALAHMKKMALGE